MALSGIGFLFSSTLVGFGGSFMGFTFSGAGRGMASGGGVGGLGCGVSLYSPSVGSKALASVIVGGCGMGMPAAGTMVTFILWPRLPPRPDHWSRLILKKIEAAMVAANAADRKTE